MDALTLMRSACLMVVCVATVACHTVQAWDTEPPGPATLLVQAEKQCVIAILAAEFGIEDEGSLVSGMWMLAATTEDGLLLKFEGSGSTRSGLAGYGYLSPVYHHHGRPLPFWADYRIRVVAVGPRSSRLEIDAVNPQVLAGSWPNPIHGGGASSAVIRNVPATGIEERVILRACGEALGVHVSGPVLPPRGIAWMRTQLSANDQPQFRQAINTLGILRDEHAVPGLARIIARKSTFSEDAADALAEIGTATAVPPLVGGLRTGRRPIAYDSRRYACLRALSRMGDVISGAVDELIRFGAAHGGSSELTLALVTAAPGDPRVIRNLETSPWLVAKVALYCWGHLEARDLLRALRKELRQRRRSRFREVSPLGHEASLVLGQCRELPTDVLALLESIAVQETGPSRLAMEAILARAKSHVDRIR